MKPKRNKPRCWCGRTRKQHEQNPDKCVIGYTEREGGSKVEAGAKGSNGNMTNRVSSEPAVEPANVGGSRRTPEHTAPSVQCPASPTEPTNEQILMMLREAKLSYNEIVRHFYRLNRAEQIKAAEQRGREETITNIEEQIRGKRITIKNRDMVYFGDVLAALRREKR